MTKTLVFANQKGGVGKTTSAVNVSAGLARAGQQVLLVDMDPQANSTFALTGKEFPDANMYHVLKEERLMEEIITGTQEPNLALAPSDIELSGAEVELIQAVGGQQRLRSALEEAAYDYIIIDAPPSLGFLTVNALAASDEVIIPLDCGVFSLRGLLKLEDTIEKVRQHFGQRLKVMGVVCTLYDHTRVARDVVKAIRDRYGELAFETYIPKNIALEEAHSRAQHVFSYAPESNGAEAYANLVQEVLNRG